MHNILIFIESRYKVNRKKIREVVKQFLKKEGLKRRVEVGIAIVGDRKVKSLNKKFRGKDETTTVLSFPLEDFISSPDGFLRLGDVIISYPQAVLRACEDNVLVEEKIEELLRHGLENLVGKSV